MLPAFEWRGDHLLVLDQRYLPEKEEYLELRDYKDVAYAIKNMVVRGAPAIGLVAAYGIALGVKTVKRKEELEAKLEEIYETLAKTRPTARNLFTTIDRFRYFYDKIKDKDLEEIKKEIEEEAIFMEEEDYNAAFRLSCFGADLLKNNFNVLTHCNSGGLATSGWGTALGVIKMVHKRKKKIHVYVTETRPLLQGARLTAYELSKAGIPFTLITDSMAGWIMRKEKVDAVIVGADRIALNGDTANKIGTYSLAVLAKENLIPFYVVAPISTIDLDIWSEKEITIEERGEEEVKSIIKGIEKLGKIRVRNPAFDITPWYLITAIITELGVFRAPYEVSFLQLKKIK